MKIGVVIPARNEAATLSDLLSTLTPFREADDPIVVVDDGSTDGTGAAARQAGVEVLAADAKGRGWAVARGVENVSAGVDAVLVLHADMRVPADARTSLVSALRENPDAVGGALGHRIDDPRFRFRAVEWGNRFRARRLRLPYGDQAQFFRPDALRAEGGFPRQETLEDLELALRLRRAGPTVYLDCPVTIPTRHWARGVVRATVRNGLTLLRYLFFAPSG